MVIQWAWMQSPALASLLGPSGIAAGGWWAFLEGPFLCAPVQQGANLCVELPRHVAKTQCLCNVGFAQGVTSLQCDKRREIQSLCL